MAKKTQFFIIRTPLNEWYFTAFLPAQLQKFKSRKGALNALAKVVQAVKAGKVELIEHDLNNKIGRQNLVGGMKHLMETNEKKGKK